MTDFTGLLDGGYTTMWGEGRVNDALRGLGDDFERVVSDHPEGAVRHGPGSVIEFSNEWIEPWEDLEIDWELEVVEPDAARSIIDMLGRGTSSGAPAEMRHFQLWSFRDGRAVRMEMFTDIDQARRAARLA